LAIGITVDCCRNGSSALPSFPSTALIAAAAASIRLITRWVVNQPVPCSARDSSEIIVFITCTLLLVVDAVPSAASLDFFIHLPGPRAHLVSSWVRGASVGTGWRSRGQQHRVRMAQAEVALDVVRPRPLGRPHPAIEHEELCFRSGIFGIRYEKQTLVPVHPEPQGAMPAHLSVHAAQQREVERGRAVHRRAGLDD